MRLKGKTGARWGRREQDQLRCVRPRRCELLPAGRGGSEGGCSCPPESTSSVPAASGWVLGCLGMGGCSSTLAAASHLQNRPERSQHDPNRRICCVHHAEPHRICSPGRTRLLKGELGQRGLGRAGGPTHEQEARRETGRPWDEEKEQGEKEEEEGCCSRHLFTDWIPGRAVQPEPLPHHLPKAWCPCLVLVSPHVPPGQPDLHLSSIRMQHPMQTSPPFSSQIYGWGLF